MPSDINNIYFILLIMIWMWHGCGTLVCPVCLLHTFLYTLICTLFCIHLSCWWVSLLSCVPFLYIHFWLVSESTCMPSIPSLRHIYSFYINTFIWVYFSVYDNKMFDDIIYGWIYPKCAYLATKSTHLSSWITIILLV